uniref:Ependymin-related protein 4.10 n=1 Tax=Platynereis dumerilii TaxID=6359 RepID=A0A411F674_PLADU|nr:Ependymin-related protein 4.10 [Platynereis dumerilii]
MNSLLVLLGLVSLSYGSAIWSRNMVKDPACCFQRPGQFTFLGEVLYNYAGAAVPFQQMMAVYATEDGIDGVKYFDRKSGKLTSRAVIDFKNGFIYRINEGGECMKQATKAKQLSGCMPESAKWVGEYRVGNGLDSIYGYTFQFTQPSKNLAETLSVSRNCVPLHVEKTVTTPQGATIQNGGIINPSLKITEKGIFDIPATCNSVEAGSSDFKAELLPVPSFLAPDME